jgi:hypothetical protein
MTDQEKLLYIETERAKLEARLTKKCGAVVRISASIHQCSNQDHDNHGLARAGLALKWRASWHKTDGWITSSGNTSSTTVYFNRKRSGGHS